VGAGATTLVDALLESGYENVIATDISKIALEKLSERLGGRAQQISCLVDDVTDSRKIVELENISVWHDRAVLHFLQQEVERQRYLKLLKQVLVRGGYVMIAVFSLQGAKKCSGLDVRRYDHQLLADFLGNDFEVLEYFDYLYRTPSGAERPYIYTAFRRKLA